MHSRLNTTNATKSIAAAVQWTATCRRFSTHLTIFFFDFNFNFILKQLLFIVYLVITSLVSFVNKSAVVKLPHGTSAPPIACALFFRKIQKN